MRTSDEAKDTPPGVSVFFDADEYVFLIDDIEKTSAIRYEDIPKDTIDSLRQDPSYQRIVSSYYYQQRGSISVVSPRESRQMGRVKNLIRKTRDHCLSGARYLAIRQCIEKRIFEPQWLKIVDDWLINHQDKSVRDAWNRIEIILSQQPEIQPTLYLDGYGHKLRLATLIRSFLKQMNSGLAHIHAKLVYPEQDDQDVVEYIKDVNNEMMIGLAVYAWFSRDEFNPNSLPEAGYSSRHACDYARRLSLIQMAFIILHEVAHLALGHLSEGWVPSERIGILVGGEPHPLDDRGLQELEADTWAFEALNKIDGSDNNTRIIAISALLNYMRLFEATASTKLDEETLRLQGQRYPIVSTTRLSVFKHRFSDNILTEDQRRTLQVLTHHMEESLAWINSGDGDFIDTVVRRGTFQQEY
jgi:hypothetical protein